MVGMVRRNDLFGQGNVNLNLFREMGWGGWIGKTVLKVYVNYQEEKRDGYVKACTCQNRNEFMTQII